MSARPADEARRALRAARERAAAQAPETDPAARPAPSAAPEAAGQESTRPGDAAREALRRAVSGHRGSGRGGEGRASEEGAPADAGAPEDTPAAGTPSSEPDTFADPPEGPVGTSSAGAPTGAEEDERASAARGGSDTDRSESRAADIAREALRAARDDARRAREETEREGARRRRRARQSAVDERAAAARRAREHAGGGGARDVRELLSDAFRMPGLSNEPDATSDDPDETTGQGSSSPRMTDLLRGPAAPNPESPDRTGSPGTPPEHSAPPAETGESERRGRLASGTGDPASRDFVSETGDPAFRGFEPETRGLAPRGHAPGAGGMVSRDFASGTGDPASRDFASGTGDPASRDSVSGTDPASRNSVSRTGDAAAGDPATGSDHPATPAPTSAPGAASTSAPGGAPTRTPGLSHPAAPAPTSALGAAPPRAPGTSHPETPTPGTTNPTRSRSTPRTTLRSMAAPDRDNDLRRTFPRFPPRQGETFAASWWGNAWVAALEQGALDAKRLERGRGYAEQGNVDAITVTPGLVLAYVQGSRPRPYRVQVRLRTLDDTDWDRLLDVAADRPGHIAALLDKEMPQSLADCGVPLLPGPGDLEPRCSCPDRAHPCKHAAALCYQTARLLDTDPFVLLLLRGRGERELLDALSRLSATRAARAAQDKEPAPTPGVRATEVLAARTLPPLPAPLPPPPHPEQPPAYPASPGGPDPFALDQLATDAAARAHALLTTGRDPVGQLTFWQDAVRLAAARPGAGLTAGTRALYSSLASAAGRTPSELARAVAAWRQGGPEGLAVLEEPWDPPAGRFDRARPLLLAADLPAFRPWRNHLTHPHGHIQLRLGRDGLWYAYESEPGREDWWPRGTPDLDPVGALTGLGLPSDL
ncbi:SWIM zinc finger family protein [Streptomyces sp. NPDC002788]